MIEIITMSSHSCELFWTIDCMRTNRTWKLDRNPLDLNAKIPVICGQSGIDVDHTCVRTATPLLQLYFVRRHGTVFEISAAQLISACLAFFLVPYKLMAKAVWAAVQRRKQQSFRAIKQHDGVVLWDVEWQTLIKVESPCRKIWGSACSHSFRKRRRPNHQTISRRVNAHNRISNAVHWLEFQLIIVAEYAVLWATTGRIIGTQRIWNSHSPTIGTTYICSTAHADNYGKHHS